MTRDGSWETGYEGPAVRQGAGTGFFCAPALPDRARARQKEGPHVPAASPRKASSAGLISGGQPSRGSCHAALPGHPLLRAVSERLKATRNQPFEPLSRSRGAEAPYPERTDPSSRSRDTEAPRHEERLTLPLGTAVFRPKS